MTGKFKFRSRGITTMQPKLVSDHPKKKKVASECTIHTRPA